LIRAVLGRPKRKAGEGERSKARSWAGAGKKASGPKWEGEKMNFSFLNTFSNLIFKLNLNSIQILVKANHYKKNMQQHECINMLLTLYLIFLNFPKIIIFLYFNAHIIA